MIRYFHGFQSIDELDFEKVDGLMPAIVQDCQTGQVLMMGYMTKESLQKTLDTGFVTFFSRTRQKLWTKGEESGHTQKVHELRLDCDGDAIVMLIDQKGGIACHTGRESCFYSVWQNEEWVTVDAVIKNEDEIYSRGQ